MSMDVSAVSGVGGMQALSGASRALSPDQKMSNLFDSIDTAGSGTITKAQFEQAFQTSNTPGVFKQQGADAIFAQLDPNGTGSVSKADFIAGMTKLMSTLRGGHHHHHQGGDAPPAGDTSGLQTSLAALNQLGPNPPPADSEPGSTVNVSA
jgi:hypothetical protein